MGDCRETEPDTSATQEGLDITQKAARIHSCTIMQGLDITQKAARIHSGGGRDMLKVWAQKDDHVKSRSAREKAEPEGPCAPGETH